MVLDALGRQHFWRCSQPDLSIFQPPDLTSKHSWSRLTRVFLCHKSVIYLCLYLDSSTSSPHWWRYNLYSSVSFAAFMTRNTQGLQRGEREGNYYYSKTSPVKVKNTLPAMHAQAPSSSIAISRVENIGRLNKGNTESSGQDITDEPAHNYNAANLINHPSTRPSSPCQCKQPNTPATSSGANNCTDTTHESPLPLQNTNIWGSKTLNKCSTNSSRNSLTLKSKGLCCGRRRLTDEDGYIRRAACICVNKEETQVLLVTSKKDPCVWLVPGGGLEAGEEAVAAAQREAWEEAGIQGFVERFLGIFESCHHSGLKKHRTAVFVFVVTKEHKDFPEARLGRRRRWFSMEEALLLLARHRPLQSAYIQLLMMSKLKMSATS